MEFFWKHAPKMAFAAVAVGCATGLVAQDMNLKAAAPPDLTAEIEKIRAALRRHPSADYSYGERAIAALDFNAAGDRLELAPVTFDLIAQYVAYPIPARPTVSGKAQLDLEIVEERAALGVVSAITLTAEPGRNVLKFELPPLKFMKLLRIEIFRDDEQAAVPSTTPYAAMKFADDPEAPAGESVSVNATPPNAQTFQDTTVEPRKTYAYRLRAVCRMVVQPEKQTLFTDANGNAAFRVIHAPQNAQRANATALEFAGELSESRRLLSASNCDVRFSGLIGDISPEGVPQERRRTDYKAAFNIRIWMRREWKEASLQAAPGERLKGTVLLRNPETKRMEAVDFDSGLELVEVKWGQIRRSIMVEEPQLNAAGHPRLDKTGRPIMDWREKDSEPIPNETAVLRDLPTGKIIEIPKAGGVTPKSNARSR